MQVVEQENKKYEELYKIMRTMDFNFRVAHQKIKEMHSTLDCLKIKIEKDDSKHKEIKEELEKIQRKLNGLHTF